MKAAVFHRIGEPNRETFTNSIEQILAYDGVITFDGAYESVYKYREVLKYRDVILFVQGRTIGTDGICTLKQIHELANEYGFWLGWHGWSHRRLTHLPDHVVIAELTLPDVIKTKLYAYPHGDWSERTANLVRQMGFLRAYSTIQGNDDDYSLHREYL